VWALALLILGSVASPSSAREETRIQPIAPWERVAVELAVVYAESGAAAWWDRLAADSPLVALGRERALAEIGVRAGPSRGSLWRLQTVVDDGDSPPPHGGELAVFALHFPSGLDEALILELVETAHGWQLFDLRVWAESGRPVHGDEGTPGAVALASNEFSAMAAESARPEAPAPKPPLISPWQRVWGPLVGLVLLVVAASVRRHSRLFAWFLLLLGIASILLTLFLPGPIEWTMPIPWSGTVLEPESHDDESQEEPAPVPTLDSLVTLAPLRSALAAGVTRDRIDRLFTQVTNRLAGLDEDSPGEALTIARLWRAQYELAEGNLVVAGALLDELPSSGVPPLGEILRARLGLLRGEGVETALGYERALAVLPAFDGLLLEAAEGWAASGFDGRAEALFNRLAASGSRQAGVYDRLIDQAALRHDEEEALAFFNTAWRLQPAERSQLLADPVRSFLVRRYNLFSVLELARPREPVPLAAQDGRSEGLNLPAGFTATYCGESLLLARDRTHIEVPGGLGLAPPIAEAEGADSRRQRTEERILAALSEVETAASGLEDDEQPSFSRVGRLEQPIQRAQLETAALALARDHRWDDLLRLTAPFAALTAPLPPSVGALRAEALRRAGKVEEATRLVVSIAKSNVAAGRKAPHSLFQLARLLTEVEEWDLAIRAVQTAEEQMLEPPLVSIIPRIQMEKRLAQGYKIHRSRHFEVRYPSATRLYFVEQLTEVLEKETRRLQKWIPYEPEVPIEVHLFPFREFFRLYSQGGEVVGLFDGRVRVPMAEVRRLNPTVVAILSHELAHALIAGATDDRAPAWFHEGLAQHVQMLQAQINPIPDYLRQGKLVAFPLLDPILDGRGDSQLVQLAYDEARWALHYFEVRHGRRSIHRMLKAFERGRTTAQAIATVTGMSVEQLDADLWNWAEGRKTWETEVVRYDR